jgi:hypothetical protein
VRVDESVSVSLDITDVDFVSWGWYVDLGPQLPQFCF